MLINEDDTITNGRYGYTHWSGKPTDDQHTGCLVPQSIADGWECWCSCGKWRAFANFRDVPGRDDLLKALRDAHGEHVSSGRQA